MHRITNSTETNSDGVTTWSYSYDASKRLTSATQQGLFNHSYVYTYDAAGNRTSEQIDGVTSTESANSVNQLTNQSGTSTSISYDPAGNETTKVGAAGGYVFDWDGANRCTAIGSLDYQFSIAYDSLNRWTHITQCDANCTNLLADRWFVWNGTTLTEERDSSGTLIQRFYANGFWRAGTNYLYIRDHLGSVRQVIDQTGTVVAKFDYDPYARRTQTFGTMWVDYGYAGLFELPNGLKLALGRIYDPSTGRWINRDPIRESGGWNLYAYCDGNPVNFIDITGYDPNTIIIITEGHGVGALSAGKAIAAHFVNRGWTMLTMTPLQFMKSSIPFQAVILSGHGDSEYSGGLPITGLISKLKQENQKLEAVIALSCHGNDYENTLFNSGVLAPDALIDGYAGYNWNGPMQINGIGKDVDKWLSEPVFSIRYYYSPVLDTFGTFVFPAVKRLYNKF